MKKVLFNVSIVGGMLMLLLAAFSALAQEESDFSPLADDSLSAFHEGLASNEGPASQADITIQNQQSAPACTSAQCAYLPVTTNPPKVTAPLVAHKTDCSAESTVTSIDSSNVVDLGSGQRQLQFALLAQGYQGSQYEAFYIINGTERRDLDRSGTITSDSFSMTSISLVFKKPTETGCQERFPAGTYAVRFLIDGVVVQELTAVLS